MKPSAFVWSIVLSCFLTLGLAHGVSREQEFAQHNFAITPPDGWQDITQAAARPGLLAAFGNESKTGLFLVAADEKNVPQGPLDDHFAEEFDQGVESSGAGKRIAGRFFDLAGIKCYERLGEATIGGKAASTVIRVIPTAGRFYNLQGMTFDGTRANENPALKNALDSFRFLNAPEPAKADPTANKSEAYQAGYKTGRVLGFALVGGIIILVIRSFASRRR